MGSRSRELARAVLAKQMHRSKEVLRAIKHEKVDEWPEHRQKAFVHLMGEFYHLKTDAERVRFTLMWAESVFNTGQAALTEKMEAKINALEMKLEEATRPKIELVGAD